MRSIDERINGDPSFLSVFCLDFVFFPSFDFFLDVDLRSGFCLFHQRSSIGNVFTLFLSIQTRVLLLSHFFPILKFGF